jgi:hypothetical protein
VTIAPSSKGDTGRPTVRPTLIPTAVPSTAAPTVHIVSYMTRFEADRREDAVGVHMSAFGTILLFGQVLTPEYILSAGVVFADNCGVIERKVIIGIPSSAIETLSGYMDLAGGEMLFVGDALADGRSVGLLSHFSKSGQHVATTGMKWDLPVSFLSATSAFGNRVYVGYSGEGLNYQDALIVMHGDSGIVWARRYSFGTGIDIAHSVSTCTAGVVVVGTYGEGRAMHGFVMILSPAGSAIVVPQAYDNTVFREVKPTSNGGYAIVGESFVNNRTCASLLLGNADGDIIKTILFSPYEFGQSLRGYSVEELANGIVAVSIDSEDNTDTSNIKIKVLLAKVRLVTGDVISARYLGEYGDTKTYGRSVLKSPQGGHLLVGTSKGRLGTFKHFIGQIPENGNNPPLKASQPIPLGGLVTYDARSNVSARSVTFIVSEMAGYRAVAFTDAVATSVPPAQEYVSFGQGACVPEMVTPAPSSAPSGRPSAMPSTARPSTGIPTGVPSLSPSGRPTTQRPSFMPVTHSPTQANSTNEPTAGPTLLPSQSPTKHPTTAAPSLQPSTMSPSSAVPSAAPSMNPTARPSTAAPSSTPSSAAPSLLPTTPHPSSEPSAEPSEALPPGEEQASASFADSAVLSSFFIASGALFGLCIIFACCKFRGKLGCRVRRRKSHWSRRGAVAPAGQLLLGKGFSAFAVVPSRAATDTTGTPDGEDTTGSSPSPANGESSSIAVYPSSTTSNSKSTRSVEEQEGDKATSKSSSRVRPWPSTAPSADTATRSSSGEGGRERTPSSDGSLAHKAGGGAGPRRTLQGVPPTARELSLLQARESCVIDVIGDADAINARGGSGSGSMSSGSMFSDSVTSASAGDKRLGDGPLHEALTACPGGADMSLYNVDYSSSDSDRDSDSDSEADGALKPTATGDARQSAISDFMAALMLANKDSVSDFNDGTAASAATSAAAAPAAAIATRTSSSLPAAAPPPAAAAATTAAAPSTAAAAATSTAAAAAPKIDAGMGKSLVDSALINARVGAPAAGPERGSGRGGDLIEGLSTDSDSDSDCDIDSDSDSDSDSSSSSSDSEADGAFKPTVTGDAKKSAISDFMAATVAARAPDAALNPRLSPTTTTTTTTTAASAPAAAAALLLANGDTISDFSAVTSAATIRDSDSDSDSSSSSSDSDSSSSSDSDSDSSSNSSSSSN